MKSKVEFKLMLQCRSSAALNPFIRISNQSYVCAGTGVKNCATYLI